MVTKYGSSSLLASESYRKPPSAASSSLVCTVAKDRTIQPRNRWPVVRCTDSTAIAISVRSCSRVMSGPGPASGPYQR